MPLDGERSPPCHVGIGRRLVVVRPGLVREDIASADISSFRELLGDRAMMSFARRPGSIVAKLR